jgi:hypothetical protein
MFATPTPSTEEEEGEGEVDYYVEMLVEVEVVTFPATRAWGP